MADNENKYWAFLSYSPADNREQRAGAPDVQHRCWASWLHEALKAFTVPAEFIGQLNGRGELIPERIAPLFLDEQELSEPATLSAERRQTLEQSICLIVICSPRAAQSLGMNEAVRYFKQLGRGRQILPFVVAGEPNASEGNHPGRSPEEECFVPALRHPVLPDGTLDLTRRAAKHIFVDARHGAEKREILAEDQRSAEADLEMAKIQLIALLLGVGFNGLWWREQKRHFFDFAQARQQVREALQQVEEVRRQLQDAQRQTREAQNQALETQNLPRDVQGQIQDAQHQALEAQNQAREVQKQLQEFQTKVRETQTQLDEARQRALAAEGKVQEAQSQARVAQIQLEETRNQAREAQEKVLEIQNLPPAISPPIQETENLVPVAGDAAPDQQNQLEESRRQAQEAQDKLLAAQSHIEDARKQSQQAQSEVEAARNEVRDTQNKFIEAQSQVQEFQNQARAAQSQLEEARHQIGEAQGKVLAAQHQTREAQDKIQEIENRTRDVQSLIQEAKDKTLAAEKQAHLEQTQVQEIQQKHRAARRLTKVLAVIAVLAALAASIAWWQRQLAIQAVAKTGTTEVGKSDLAAGILNREQIQQVLQKLNSTSPNENQWRSLDELAIRIPAGEIPDTMNAAAVVLEDPQRSHFQEQLLDFWMKTNLPAAFDWSCQLTNVDARQRALEKIIPALAADNLTNTLERLNDLKPTPGEQSYTLLFQRWATNDPVQAIDQRQQIPGHDADAKILSAILTVWMAQQPAAALNWLASQPDSEALPAGTWRSAMIADLFSGWAANDLEAATTACQQMPDSTAKEKAWERVLSQRIVKAPASAAELVKNLPPGDYRQKAIIELCNHWVGTNAPEVLAWAQTLPVEAERMAVTNQVIVNWAKNDPQTTAQFADHHAELPGAVFGEIAQAWFQRDFNATTNWISSLPDGGKNAVLLAVMETWAQHDPKGMAAYALALPAGDVQTRYLIMACRQLTVHDLPGAVELLQPMADAALRQSILESAAGNCDPAHMYAAGKYIAAMPAGDAQKAAIKGLLSSWAPADPETAVNWLISFPETDSQPVQVQSVIKTWAQSEPSAVARWLANLPAGTANEAMCSAFLEGSVAKYPEYAAQWTQSVTDEIQRQKYQVQLAKQWMKSDPSAASKWIDSLALPEAIKQPLKAQQP
ncbi:MAG: hypothetical protein WCS42_12460 [Verrucomicrobiota bacterium]